MHEESHNAITTNVSEFSDSDSDSSQGKLKKLKQQEQYAQLSKDAKLLSVMLRVDITQEGRIGKIKKALAQGANVNFQSANYDYNSPLHIAVQQGEREVVKFLLEQGANPEIKNKQGQIPLMIALKREATGKLKEPEMVTWLTHSLPEQLKRDSALFAAMLKRGISQEQRIAVIQHALAQGADINAQDSSHQGNTALHQAVLREEIEVVQFLLEQGAHCNIKNQIGQTAIRLAMKMETNDLEKNVANRRLYMRFAGFEDDFVKDMASFIDTDGISALDKNHTTQDFVNFANAFSQRGGQPIYQQALAAVATYINTKGVEYFSFTPKALKTLAEAFGQYGDVPACQQAVASITAQGQLQSSSAGQDSHLPQLVQTLSAGSSPSSGIEATSSVLATTCIEGRDNQCPDLTQPHH